MKENQRVTMSKRMLKEALIDTLKRKPLEEITVSEICDSSGINRTTFYRHYNNPTDMIEEIAGEFFEKINECNQSVYKEGAMSPIFKVIQYVYEHKETSYLISEKSVYQIIMKRFNTSLPDDILKSAMSSNGMDEVEKKYTIKVIYASSYTIMNEWLANGMKEKPETVARIILNVSEKLLG